jgi:transglutaminase-like putative cysteine protease
MVETVNADGIIGQLSGMAPAGVFARTTPLTEADRAIDTLAASFRGKFRDQIALYHALMAAIAERMKFDTGHTDAATTAAAALKAGHGVCQDFAHVFLAVCRCLDLPGRYVTGYLVMKEGEVEADAHHAWVEAEVAGLGWVGFDPTNGICPDEHYVRLACGLDAASAAPIRGIRRGAGLDSLAVNVTVEVQQ